ncbi:MAG: formate dehydrogenase accessory sulfurtransferase FdhD [Gammaproteobacteria bacterium]|nr:formate dehydrogenase accessory sulfurtransferase FdhD [Gammaproteobacteria bacterium]
MATPQELHSLPAHGLRVSSAGQREAITWQVPEEVAVGLAYNKRPHVVMMATPADLEDFAYGFSLTEGLVQDIADVTDLERLDVPEGVQLSLTVREGALTKRINDKRGIEGRSGCGLCGISTLTAAMRPVQEVSSLRAIPAASAIMAAYRALPEFQPMNRANRTVHAAALCDIDGNILLCREDVGRHNALDKLIGAALRADLLVQDCFVAMSSRCSYELVAKCAAAGIRTLATISAPTALALNSAHAAGMTLAACAGGSDVAIFSPGEALQLAAAG